MKNKNKKHQNKTKTQKKKKKECGGNKRDEIVELGVLFCNLRGCDCERAKERENRRRHTACIRFREEDEASLSNT